MAWSSISTQVTGYTILATDWNALVNNILESAAAKVTTQGDTVYATGANALSRLAIGAANTVLGSNGTIPGWVSSLSLGGTLAVTGNFAINTNKFTVAAASGNTVIAGTLTSGSITTGAFNITSNAFVAGGANGKIIGGATNFSIRNNADSADNLLVSDAGDVTVRGDLSVGDDLTVTDDAAISGDLSVTGTATAGVFQSTTGSTSCPTVTTTSIGVAPAINTMGIVQLAHELGFNLLGLYSVRADGTLDVFNMLDDSTPLTNIRLSTSGANLAVYNYDAGTYTVRWTVIRLK